MMKISMLKTTLALVTVLALVGQAAEMLCRVSVGAPVNDGNVMLEFGYGDAQRMEEMPPFSQMFGVKDCYLVNPNRIGEGGTASIGEIGRLATDVRAGTNAQTWIITASADMTLYFDLAAISGKTLQYFYDENPAKVDGKVTKSGELATGASVAVKAGSMVTISDQTPAITQTPAVAADLTVLYKYLVKNEDTGSYSGASNAGEHPQTGDNGTASVSLVAGTAKVAVEIDGNIYTEDGINADDCVWKLTIGEVTPANTPAFADGLFTFTAQASTPYTVTFTTQKGSAPALAAVFAQGPAVSKIFNVVPIQDGTLDLDGNGVIDYNDTIYFYNYVSRGMGARLQPNHISPYTLDATTEQLQAALDCLRANGDVMDLDGNGVIDYNDTIYFYNYVSRGMGARLQPNHISPSTLDVTTEQLQTALERMRSLSAE